MPALGGRGSCRAAGCWASVPELVLGGPRGGPLGRARRLPSRRMQGQRARAGARRSQGRPLGRARRLPSRRMLGQRARAGARGARGRPLGRARLLPSRRMLGKRARAGARGSQGRAAWEGEAPAEPQDAGPACPSWSSAVPGAAAWEGEAPAEPQDAGPACPNWCSGGPGAGRLGGRGSCRAAGCRASVPELVLGGPRGGPRVFVVLGPHRGTPVLDSPRVAGSTKNRVCTCRLQFDGVGEKRTGYCFRARKKTLRRKRRHPSARLGVRLECGGRHGLKPMLRRPSSSSGMMPRLCFACWLSAQGMAERWVNVGGVLGLCGYEVAGQECPGYGCGGRTMGSRGS